jgi:hypothetical protein
MSLIPSFGIPASYDEGSNVAKLFPFLLLCCNQQINIS